MGYFAQKGVLLMKINGYKKGIFKTLVSIILVLCLVLSNGAIIGFAAQTTASITTYGVVHSTTNTRYTAGVNPVLNIVNDQEDGNFSIGFVAFDMTNLQNASSVSNAYFSFSTNGVEAEPKGLTFYYASNNAAYLLSTGANNLGSTSIFGSDNGHISRAKSYFGLTEVATISESRIAQNSSYSVDLSNAFNSALSENKSKCVVMIMQSSSGQKSSAGGWTDTNITFNSASALNMTISEKPVDTNAAINQMKSAMSAYETKMASGTVYTNMENAYNAYVNCQKAYDAYYYGGKTDINFTSYTNALTSATNSMGLWSKPTTSVVPKFDSNETTSTSNATNCLWAENNTDPLASGMTGSNNTVYNVYYHTGVYMYTDVAPKIPFIIGFYRYSSWGSPANPRVWYAYLSSSTGGLNIANSSYVGDVGSRHFSTLMGSGYRIYSTATTSSSYNIILSSGDVRYMANQFSVSQISDSTSYVKAYPNTLVYGVGSKDNASSINKTESHNIGSGKPLYIINYRPLYNQITNSIYKSYLRNVANYKEGGLSNLMKAFDSATSVNPKNYDYSSNTESMVTTCAGKISTALSNFKGVGTPTTDSAMYNSIRASIESAKNNYSENPTITNNYITTTKFDETSFGAVTSALNTAKNAMANVLSNGYASTFNGSSISTISSNLTNSINNLNQNYIVEYHKANGSYVGSKVYAKGENTNVNDFANTPTVAGKNTNRNHKTYSWESIEVGGNETVITITEKEVTSPCTLTTPITTKEPTCTSSGTETQSCMICGSQYTNIMSQKSHSYIDTVIQPTCTTKGYTIHKCADCDYSYTDTETQMLPHSFIETTVEATCETGGYKAKRCSVCGYDMIEESSITDALGHQYICDRVMIGDCTSPETFEYTCSRCNDSYTEYMEINPNVHSDVIYARTIAPTGTTMGYDIYYCSYLCGYWEKRNITAPTNIVAEDNAYSDYLEVYNEAYKYIETEYADYTRESITAYWAEIARAREIAENAIESNNPADIDTATTMIIEAKSILK